MIRRREGAEAARRLQPADGTTPQPGALLDPVQMDHTKEVLSLFRQLLTHREDALAYLETVLRYLAQASGPLDEPTLRQALVQALPSDVGENVMPTLAETRVKQGIEQGIERGKEQGSLISLRRTLRRLLTKRFGPLPQPIDAHIEQAESAALEAWFDQAIDAPFLERIFDDTR